MMARFFPPNDPLQVRGNVWIADISTQAFSKVVLNHAEQAGANLPICREAKPVAVTAERFTHGRDDADFAASIGKAPPPGGF